MFAIHRKLIPSLAGFLTLAALACSPAPATAGEYDVWSCRGPVGEVLGMGGWFPRYSEETIGDFWADVDCPSGGPFELNMNNVDTGTRRPRFSMIFDLPSGATIASYRLYRAMEAAPPSGSLYDYAAATREGAYGVFADQGCKTGGAGGDFPCQSQGFFDPLFWDDPANEVDRVTPGLNGLELWVGCVNDSGCNPGGFLPVAASYALHQSRVTIHDGSSPSVNGFDGTLAGPDPVWGRANLFVEASDTISGIKSISLSIDGTPVQTVVTDSGTCAEPYEVTRPCPLEAARVLTVDTSLLVEGSHVAAGLVTDAAGNSTPYGPVSFVVESPGDPGPPVPEPDNGTPSVQDPVIGLDAGTVWHGDGATPVIQGRLTTQSGIPVSGAVLGSEATQLAVTDYSPVALQDQTTDADGRFSIPVPGSGARLVSISFSPYAGAPVTSRAVVQIKSRIKLTLKRKPKKIRIGKKVKFSGKFSGAGPSAGGVPVEIQAKVAGRWETVATVRSRPNGSWVWPYRFKHVKRKAVFSFRAVVNAVPGWPWATTRSPVRKVRITLGRR